MIYLRPATSMESKSMFATDSTQSERGHRQYTAASDSVLVVFYQLLLFHIENGSHGMGWDKLSSTAVSTAQ